MKWNGFIMGGIVGVAAAAYLSRKRPGAFAWAGNATGDLMSGMKGRLIETALKRKFGSETKGKQSGTAASRSDEKSWDTIEALLNGDPEVKRQADRILSESSSASH